jgi:UDP-glucose 4,6-dehydratase
MYLVIGSNGYVGSYFLEHLNQCGWPVRGLSRKEVDYSNTGKLASFLKDIKPTFIINAAGYTGKPNVDACELAKAECLSGNAVLPGIIREVCEDLKIPWGHVSSGCIFSGRKSDGRGWTENDEPNFSFRSPPCSFYSGTKALGEEVLEGAENCYIWRLRIPFNEERSPRNYLQKLLNYDSLLEAENSVSHLGEFVEKCVECFEKEVEPGIYNMTNPGSVTTRKVTEWMKEEGVTDKQFQFFEDEEQFMSKAAKTPRSNCVLDTTKAEKAGIGMRPVEEAMRESMQKMVKVAAV